MQQPAQHLQQVYAKSAHRRGGLLSSQLRTLPLLYACAWAQTRCKSRYS
jgi:hypothetical protein